MMKNNFWNLKIISIVSIYLIKFKCLFSNVFDYIIGNKYKWYVKLMMYVGCWGCVKVYYENILI